MERKIFTGGCGMGCGTLPDDISGNLKIALQRGYATAIMNSGHWGPDVTDLTWAFNNPQAELDYAYRAVHNTISATKALVKIFYEKDVFQSYYWSCSGGGRMGVMSAARYPRDFDGIISEAPALDFSGWAVYAAWLRQTNTGPNGKDILTQEDLPVIIKAIYDACDRLEGKEDGLMGNLDQCQFDPEVLFCENPETCLSREKVSVLKKWYQGPLNSKGEKLLTSGISLGSEPFWGFWFLGVSDEPFDEFTPWNGLFQYLMFKEDPGPEYSVLDFDFDKDPERLEYMGNLLNVRHLSLQPFKDSGGKLLMYHGLSDPMIPYQSSVDFYDRNVGEFGKETTDFFRLFLIPGLDHCGVIGALGITKESLDPLTALETWVEKNNQPKELPVTRYENDGTVRSRFTVPFYRIHK